MTPLLLTVLVLLAFYGIYFAARVARLETRPLTFLDAGQTLPGWAVMFVLPGLAIAGLGVERHLGLVARYGLQASHVAVGLIVVGIATLIVWNRMWYATRIAGLTSPGDALGRFYQSIALRVVMLALTVLFALPFSANILSFAGQVLDEATGGLIPRIAGVWLLAISLMIPAIIGGWRATILTLAMQSVLLAILIPGVTVFAEVVSTSSGFPAQAMQMQADGVGMWNRIPGVIQYTAGIGKEVPPMGIFSAVGIASSALALLGIVFSPATLYLGQTVRAGCGLGVSTVWLTGGFATGGLILTAPALALRMTDGPVALAQALHDITPLGGVAVILLVMTGALLAVAFFTTGGTIIFTRELIIQYVFPDLPEPRQRYAARVALGFAFFILAFMASFLPMISAIFASVALPLAVQLLPALLGLTLVRWISTGAVLAGLTLGMLVVVFTEPPGLILFEALFVELPWGRWPLTIHSAAWGLAVNLTLVLLSSMVTQKASDSFQRNRLHDALQNATCIRTGGLLWALMLIWGFLAYGPGAILGNTFFSDPIFSPVEASLGVPSLWVWQILFWLLGVILIWWLSNRVGLGRLSDADIKPIVLGEVEKRRPPDWLTAGLARIGKNNR